MAAATADGGGRRQLVAAEDDGRRQWGRCPAETEKTGETGEGRGGRTDGGWRRWTPASVTVEATSSGGAAGWRQGSGAGDRRRREEAEKEEAGGRGASRVPGSRGGRGKEMFGFIFY